MGYMVERANILDRLFLSLQVGLRVCGFNGTSRLNHMRSLCNRYRYCGSCCYADGFIALPAMLKAGYDQRLSAGVITAGGTLGILIPPSNANSLCCYGGHLSGQIIRRSHWPRYITSKLILAVCFCQGCYKSSLAPKLQDAEIQFSQVLYLLVTSFLPLALLMFSVLGSILFGLATP